MAKSRVDLARLQRSQSIEAERLEREARNNCPVGHRGLECLEVLPILPRQIPHEPAGETVTCAGGIDDDSLVERQRWDHRTTLGVREDCAMLSLFHHDKTRPEVENPLRAADRIAHTREFGGLRVIDDDAIDALQERHEVAVSGANPKVHRVGNDELPIGELLEESELHSWMGIAEEDKLGAAVALRNAWRRLLQHADFGEERLAPVDILEIATAPREGARAMARLKSIEADAGKLAQDRGVLRGPVITDRRDDA